MNAKGDWKVYEGICKDCGTAFTFSERALQQDLALGMSAPERCPECRKLNHRIINSKGAAYWQAPLVEDDSERVWNKFGLGRLERFNAAPKELFYTGEPPKELRSRFEVIQPAVDALIKNLEDPQGTQVSILVGGTGTGKSVWATYQLLRSSIGRTGRICVTQPRLVTLRASSNKEADSTTPGYIAYRLLSAPGVGAGHEVGYLYRGESTQHDRYTRLLFITDGILIRWIISGEIRNYRVIVIDEAHEQSENMALIFSLLRRVLPLYPRLRVVIASATVDINRFAEFFGNGDPSKVFVAKPLGSSATTLKSIHDRWPEDQEEGNGYASQLDNFKLPDSPQDIPESVAKLVHAIRTKRSFTALKQPRGDIIAFVPTIALIRRTIAAVEALGLNELMAVPCYAKMTAAELRSFRISEELAANARDAGKFTNPQRVIVATNYAETSVTLSNLRYVIDSGYVMEPVWDPITCSTNYPVVTHSRAGCIQRKGRVGRESDGEVFRLYSAEDFDDPDIFPVNTLPEISRCSLDKFLLTAKAAGIDDLESFSWLGFDSFRGSQNNERIRSIGALQQAGALDEDGDITLRGLELEKIQAPTVDFSLFLSESDVFGCALEVATFLAFTGQMRDLFLRSEVGLVGYENWRAGCYDDLELYLRIFYLWSKAGEGRTKKEHETWSAAQGLNHLALLDVTQSREAALRPLAIKTHTNLTERELDLARLHRVRLVLARTMPQWLYVPAYLEVGEYIPLHRGRFRNANRVFIDQDSACLANPDVQAFVCVERNSIGDSLFAKHIVRVNTDWIALLKGASSIALALLLRKSLDRDDTALAGGTRGRVTAPPANMFTHSQVSDGSELKLRVVRYLRSGGEERIKDVLLVHDCDTEKPMLVRTAIRGLTPGMEFRVIAHPRRSGDSILPVSNDEIIAQYQPSDEALEGVIIEFLGDNDELPAYGVVIEVETGVTGILHRKALGLSADFLLEEWRVNDTIEVVVTGNNGRRLEFGLATVELEIDEGYTGYVLDFVRSRNQSRPSGVVVETAPGIVGTINARNISENDLAELEVGSKVEVVLDAVHTRDGRPHYVFSFARLSRS